MSGGSWDYLFGRVADAASRLADDDPKRAILAPHVERLANALHAIEWVDSGDYAPGDEFAAIEAFLAGFGVNADGCKVGGDPPVPGVGWGVTTTANHFGWRIVWAVRRVTFTEVGWSVGLDGEGGKGVAADEIEALYLPGAPADRPCWRRHE